MTSMIGLLLGIPTLGNAAIRFLARVGFNTDYAMGSVPATIPGELGSLTKSDPQNVFLVSAGVLETGANASSSSPNVASTALTRARGLIFGAEVMRNSAYGTSGSKLFSPALGFSPSGATGATTLSGPYFWSDGYMAIIDMNTTALSSLVPASSDTYYKFYTVLRSTGAFCVIRTGEIWKLAGIMVTGSDATTYAVVGQPSADRHPPKVKDFNVGQSFGVWASANGLATSVLAGARAAADAFTHTAGSQWLTFTLTTLPSSGTIELRYRVVDASNYWRVTISSAGALTFDEVTTSVPAGTTRLSMAGCAAGDRLRIAIDGLLAVIHRTNGASTVQTTSARYTGATMVGASAAAGVLQSLGTGGAVSDIVTYPVDITGPAQDELREVLA